jgi:hypothetical protein
MNRIHRKILLYSLLFYLGSTIYVRFGDYCFCDGITRTLFALPWDVFPLNYLEGKQSISTQIGALSSSEVAKLLETNPDEFPNMYNGLRLTKDNLSNASKEYLVLRFKNTHSRHYFDIKCYFSNFPYSTELVTSLSSLTDSYYNIILPYPEFLEENPQEPCEVFLRWKRFFSR